MSCKGGQCGSADKCCQDTDSLKTQANTLFKQGQFDQAIALYSQAIAKCKSAVLLSNRAAAFLSTGDFVSALADCDEAIRVDSSFARAYSRRATALIRQGRLAEAEAALQDARRHGADTSQPEADLATLRDDSVPMARRVQIAPASVSLLVEAGRLEQALEILRKQGDEGAERQRLEALIGDLAMAAQLGSPDAAQALELKKKGNDAFSTNDFSTALSFYEQCVAVTTNSIVFSNIAACHLALKHFEDALAAADKSLELAFNVKAAARAVMALAGLEQFDEALKRCDAFLSVSPGNPILEKARSDVRALKIGPLAGEDALAGRVVLIESEQQYADILTKAARLILVDFNAAWCGPCRQVKPMFDQWAQEFQNVLFLSVDIDKFPQLAAVNNVSAVPTFVFARGGRVIHRVQGADVGGILNFLQRA